MSDHCEEKPDKYLRILDDSEIGDIFIMPLFTDEERQTYFSLSTIENAVTKKFHTYESRIYFILQLGYFKAKQQFFNFDVRAVEADIKYILKHIFLKSVGAHLRSLKRLG